MKPFMKWNTLHLLQYLSLKADNPTGLFIIQRAAKYRLFGSLRNPGLSTVSFDPEPPIEGVDPEPTLSQELWRLLRERSVIERNT